MENDPGFLEAIQGLFSQDLAESHVIASENQKCSERLFYAVVLLLLHSVNSEKQKPKNKEKYHKPSGL